MPPSFFDGQLLTVVFYLVKTLLSLAKLALLASDENEEDDTTHILEGILMLCTTCSFILFITGPNILYIYWFIAVYQSMYMYFSLFNRLNESTNTDYTSRNHSCRSLAGAKYILFKLEVYYIRSRTVYTVIKATDGSVDGILGFHYAILQSI